MDTRSSNFQWGSINRYDKEENKKLSEPLLVVFGMTLDLTQTVPVRSLVFQTLRLSASCAEQRVVRHPLEVAVIRQVHRIQSPISLTLIKKRCDISLFSAILEKLGFSLASATKYARCWFLCRLQPPQPVLIRAPLCGCRLGGRRCYKAEDLITPNP